VSRFFARRPTTFLLASARGEKKKRAEPVTCSIRGHASSSSVRWKPRNRGKKKKATLACQGKEGTIRTWYRGSSGREPKKKGEPDRRPEPTILLRMIEKEKEGSGPSKLTWKNSEKEAGMPSTFSHVSGRRKLIGRGAEKKSPPDVNNPRGSERRRSSSRIFLLSLRRKEEKGGEKSMPALLFGFSGRGPGYPSYQQSFGIVRGASSICPSSSGGTRRNRSACVRRLDRGREKRGRHESCSNPSLTQLN